MSNLTSAWSQRNEGEQSSRLCCSLSNSWVPAVKNFSKKMAQDREAVKGTVDHR